MTNFIFDICAISYIPPEGIQLVVGNGTVVLRGTVRGRKADCRVTRLQVMRETMKLKEISKQKGT